jgi:signal transduction histidine kinase
MIIKGTARRHIPLVIFLGVMVFALVQSTWWLYYQSREGGRYRELRMDILSERVEVAKNDLRLYSEKLGLQQQDEFRQRYPGVSLMRSNRYPVGYEPVVSSKALDDIWKESNRRSRMFLFEGGFFTLMIMLGVWLQLIAHRRLNESVRQQSNFISAVTHELKSPLTSIRLYTELLNNEKIPLKTKQKCLGSISDDTVRLEEMIEQILKTRTMDIRHARLDVGPVDLISYLKKWEKEVSKRVEQRKFKLSIIIDVEKAIILADTGALKFVMSNLLDNALKYSTQGGEVRVTLNSAGRRFELSVEDDGVGFDPLFTQKIFNRFFRIGDELTRKVTGTGLGLYIVRELCSSMKAKVWAESEGQGKGARFRIIFSVPGRLKKTK